MTSASKLILGVDSAELLNEVPPAYQADDGPWSMIVGGLPDEAKGAVSEARDLALTIEGHLIEAGFDSILAFLSDGPQNTRKDLQRCILMAWSEAKTSYALSKSTSMSEAVGALANTDVTVKHFSHVAALSQLVAARHLVGRLLTRVADLEIQLSDLKAADNLEPPEIKL